MKIKRSWQLFRDRCEKFFTIGQRTAAKQKVNLKVVIPEKIEEFIEYVLSTKKVSTSYKLIVTLQLSTGSRISEILNLKKSDFKFQGDKAIAIIQVLKKRVKDKKASPHFRGGAIHPSIIPLLQEYIEGLNPEDKLFNVSRIAAWAKYQTMFGITPHALRHSWITYLFEIKHWDIAKVVGAMTFGEWRTALRYQTLNIEKDAWSMFEKDTGTKI